MATLPTGSKALPAGSEALLTGSELKQKQEKWRKPPCGDAIGHRPLRGRCPKTKTVYLSTSYLFMQMTRRSRRRTEEEVEEDEAVEEKQEDEVARA